MPVGFLWAFFYADAHDVNYLFFCLDAKEPKNQGYDALLTVYYFYLVFVIAPQFAKNRLRYAKM
ncbi:hypothetical protein CMT54_16955 [Elizabethkingia anophelis]|nr:hypothetical protein [Elizabethkingia anophelis]MDV4022363.1 hypothetical protein [Elizabethkingia anophelis]